MKDTEQENDQNKGLSDWPSRIEMLWWTVLQTPLQPADTKLYIQYVPLWPPEILQEMMLFYRIT